MVELLSRDDPSSVGPYRLLARLGQGGMGRVFLARSPDGVLVALKIIHEAYSGDMAFRRRFAHEVAAAQRVRGDYTVAVLDSDTEAGLPWLVTKYVRGRSLADTIDGHGPLSEHMVRTLGCGIALALQSVHAAGVVHRDVKPSNVIMAADGPRLVDFGISRATEASTLTASGQVVGSAGYMAPEQVEGRPVDGRADIFALGAILVYALTGNGPFGEGSAASLLYRVVHGTPEVPEIVDPALADIVPRCLAKDPAERPATAEIAAALGPAPTAGFVPPEWLPEEAPTAPAREPGAGTTTLTSLPRTDKDDSGDASAINRSDTTAPPRHRRGWTMVAVAAVLVVIGVAYAVGYRPGDHAAGGSTPNGPGLGASISSPPGPAGATSPPPPPTPPTTVTDPSPGVTPPVMPTGLTATPMGTSTVRLQWSDNSKDESGFLVNNSGSTREVGANKTSYDWAGLSAGTFACFAITAFNAGGYSDYYPTTSPGWICATTDQPPTPMPTTSPTGAATPSAPTNLTAAASSSTTILLQWTDNSNNETGFTITNGSGESRIAGSNATSYNWTGLANSTTMCFHIRTYNGSGTSSYTPGSASVCATTPLVAVPKNVTATPIGGNTIRISWTDNSNNETGFGIVTGVAPGVGGPGYGSRTVGAGVTSYDWTGLQPGSWRCFQVVAQAGSNSSDFSPWACVTGAATTPVPPTNVVISAAGGGAIQVHWTDNSNNEAGFEVSQRVNYPNGQVVGGFGAPYANVTSYDWTGLPSGTTICVRVSAWNPLGVTSIDTPPALPYCATAP